MDGLQSSRESCNAAVRTIHLDRPWSHIHDCRDPWYFPTTRADNAAFAARRDVLRPGFDYFLQCALESPMAWSADSSMAGEPQYDSTRQSLRDPVDRCNLRYFDCDRGPGDGRQNPGRPGRIVIGCLSCKVTDTVDGF